MGAFRFKQFQIEHDHSFKVGTDGVLLGAWVSVIENANVLEIGSGSGLISIMMAQRNNSSNFIGVETDKNSVIESKKNIQNCPWSNRIKILHSKLQEFSPETKFQQIITNPPFFINSTKSHNLRKNETRHTDSLTFDDIISFSKNHLVHEGLLSIILPTGEAHIFHNQIAKEGFSLKRNTKVRSKADKPVERELLEFIKSPHSNNDSSELIIQFEKRNDYTPEYINLTKDFYIIM